MGRGQLLQPQDTNSLWPVHDVNASGRDLSPPTFYIADDVGDDGAEALRRCTLADALSIFSDVL